MNEWTDAHSPKLDPQITLGNKAEEQLGARQPRAGLFTSFSSLTTQRSSSNFRPRKGQTLPFWSPVQARARALGSSAAGPRGAVCCWSGRARPCAETNTPRNLGALLLYSLDVAHERRDTGECSPPSGARGPLGHCGRAGGGWGPRSYLHGPVLAMPHTVVCAASAHIPQATTRSLIWPQTHCEGGRRTHEEGMVWRTHPHHRSAAPHEGYFRPQSYSDL